MNNYKKTITTTKEVKKYGDSLVLILTDEKRILNLERGDLVVITIKRYLK